MMFDLNNELVDQIIFAMENQDQEFVLDAESLELLPVDCLPADDPAEEERFIPLPEWTSIRGFVLMEQFVASLRNPIYRESLRQALASGKGVFRQFKNVLKENGDLERLWFHFKERQMRREVLAWYNSLRELAGLAEIDLDFEPDESLILSDFSVEAGLQASPELVRELDWKGFAEQFPGQDEGRIRGLYERGRQGLELADECSRLYSLASPMGDFTGFLWAVDSDIPPASLRVVQLYVIPEYRGLGLADLVLRRFLADAAESGVAKVSLELIGKSLGMLDALGRKGFETAAATLELDLKEWMKSNASG
jgi:GNAT superfamily N-acetyltransferase